MNDRAELERIAAFLRRIEDRAAERIEPVHGGVALFDTRVPNIWMANHVRLDPTTEIAAGALASEAERVQGGAGLQHRRITVYDPAQGRSLAPGMRALGWEVDRLVVMVQREPPEGAIKTRSVRELKNGSWRAFRMQMSRDEDMDEDTVQQMDRAIQGLIQATGMRVFGIELDGRVVSGCDLFSDGTIAQVEAVATLAAYRNRGLARAVVWRAVREARATGHGLVFLVASADDWPRTIYRRLGFREAGFFFEFLKPVPSS